MYDVLRLNIYVRTSPNKTCRCIWLVHIHESCDFLEELSMVVTLCHTLFRVESVIVFNTGNLATTYVQCSAANGFADGSKSQMEQISHPGFRNTLSGTANSSHFNRVPDTYITCVFEHFEPSLTYSTMSPVTLLTF